MRLLWKYLTMNELIPTYNIDAQFPGNENFLILVSFPTDDPPAVCCGPHSHNYYCLSVLYSGETSHFANLTEMHIAAPALLLLDMDQVHTHGSMKNCRIVHIAFAQKYLDARTPDVAAQVEHLFSNSVLKITTDQLDHLDRYIRLLLWEFNQSHNKQTEALTALLEIVLLKCCALQALGSADRGRHKSTHREFRALLRKHYRSEHQVSFYANELHVTADTLNACLKASCSKTAKQLIEEKLLAEAKRLLYWTNATVREIAWALGFESDAYFNRFFKKGTGKTPKEYQIAIRRSA